MLLLRNCGGLCYYNSSRHDDWCLLSYQKRLFVQTWAESRRCLAEISWCFSLKFWKMQNWLTQARRDDRIHRGPPGRELDAIISFSGYKSYRHVFIIPESFRSSGDDHAWISTCDWSHHNSNNITAAMTFDFECTLSSLGLIARHATIWSASDVWLNTYWKFERWMILIY